MALTVTHPFVCALADDPVADAAGEVVPSDWNADHDISVTSLTIATGTITASEPVLDLSQTWNAGAVTFTGIKLNVTDTASASASKLLDLQVGGASIFSVFKTEGGFVSSAGNLFARFSQSSAASYFGEAGIAWHLFIQRSSSRVSLAADTKFSWTDTSGGADSTVDLTLNRDAAATLALRNGTNAQTFRVYGTYTDSSNYVRASLSSTSTTVTLQSETAGTGADDVSLILRAAGAANIVPQSALRASGSGVEYQVVDGSNNTTGRFSSNLLECGSGHYIRWRDNVDARNGSADSGLARNAAGIVEVNSGTAGTFRDLKLRNLLASGGNGSYVQTPSMTVANLAAAGTAGAGARAFVTDATATTFLSTVAGGGANKVPVVSDGTNWLIG